MDSCDRPLNSYSTVLECILRITELKLPFWRRTVGTRDGVQLQ